MKKKLVLAIAVLSIIAICAVSLVACAPTGVEGYLKALKESKKGTFIMSSDGAEIMYGFNGDNMLIEVKIAGVETKAYILKEDDKNVMYSLALGKWTKSEDSKVIDAIIGTYNVSKFVSEISVDKADYDIKDGVWTHKISEQSYKVEDGLLCIYENGKKQLSYNIKAPNMTLPKEAKEAK